MGLRSSAAQALGIGNELHPGWVVRAVQVLVDPVVAADAWLARLAEERHAGLFRRPAALSVVAGLAGGDQVLPAMGTAAMARDDMVDSEVFGLFAAILAGVVVAQEQLATRQFRDRVDPLDEVEQADHRWADELVRGRVEDSLAQFDDFRLAVPDQNKGTASRTDIQWLKILVEDKDMAVHATFPLDNKNPTPGNGGGIGTSRSDCSNGFSRVQRDLHSSRRRCHNGGTSRVVSVNATQGGMTQRAHDALRLDAGGPARAGG